jgi:hypothetical protein
MTSTSNLQSNLHNFDQFNQVSNSGICDQIKAIWEIESGVHPKLVTLNVGSLGGANLFDFLYPNPKRINSGRLNERYLKLWYKCEQAAGWLCDRRFRQTSGEPINVDKKGRVQRYFNPEGGKAPITFLRVPLCIWEKVAERFGKSMPEHIELTADGEALGFWDWVLSEGIPVVLTEGEKKAGCLLTHGFAAISVPGINMGYRAIEKDIFGKTTLRELHPALKPFNDGRQITIAFDHRPGDYFQSPEWKAADATSWLLKDSEVRIAILPGPQKAVDDFAVAGGDLEKLITNAEPIAKIRAHKLWALRKYETAWQVNKEKLGSLPFPSKGIAGVLSAKGTGKTFGLKELCKEAGREGRKVLLLTHRIVLGRAICQTVGLTWIEDKYNSKEDKQDVDLFGCGLCVDSLHQESQAQFNAADWSGAIVIIDEVEQVIWHLLNSSTCQENRVSILNSFKELVNTVLDTDGLFVLQDADLSDLAFDFVLGMKDGDKPKPWIARNEYKPEKPWTVKYYDTQYAKGVTADDPSGLLKDAVNSVNSGGKIWVQTDSQKAKSKFGSVNLEKYFRAKCPGKRILRIDQTTVSDPEHPAFQCSESLQGDNSIATNYDIVICSPTLATGVSITIRSHFTAVVGIFQGACSENEVRQALARVREPVPRWVWVRKRAVALIGNGSSFSYSVAKSKEKDVRYNLRLLETFGFDFELDFDPTPFKTWAKMAARINASAWDFRDAVAEGLKAEGHILEFVNDSDLDISGAIKVIRQYSQVEEAVKVSEAQELTREEYENLSDKKCKRHKTEVERFAKEKYELHERYGVEVTPELRQLNQDKWYGKIQLHYYLTCNAEYLKMRDWKHFDRHLRQGNGKVCPQDVRLLSLRVEVHRILGTFQFTDPNLEWTKDSPAVQEFIKKALYVRRDIKDICGLTVSEQRAKDNPIGIIQDFLKQLGLSMKGEQRRKGKERERVYKFGGFASANVLAISGAIAEKISEPDGLRDKIFAQWSVKDAANLAQWKEAMNAVTPHASTQKTEPAEFVTPQTIDKDIVPTVTEPCPIAEKAWGWVNRFGQWFKARVIGWCEEGARYRVLYETAGSWSEMLAFPSQMRWGTDTLFSLP